VTAKKVFWTLVLASAATMAVTMGSRQTLGLFVSSLNTSTGLGIVTISFALAVGQFAWGAAQPLFGLLADRIGSYKVIVIGALLLALGLAMTPYMHSGLGLVVSLGLITAMGAGGGSFSILIGATAQRVPPEKRALASGVINAGGSFGQFIFAPLAQLLIGTIGWVGALWTLAASALITIPLGLPFRESKTAQAAHTAGIGIREQLRISFKDPSYLLLHAGFFTCGFHIAFLITHLPGEVNLCGLPASVSAASIAIIGLANIVGSIGAGWLSQTKRMKMVLFWMYASRAIAVALYLAAPKIAPTFYVFAFVLGITWLATVPPTAGLVGKLFGTRHLATLFGLTLLTHQIGGFFGAWLGGIAIASTGNYNWMWYADIALAAMAALLNLPIKEAQPRAVAAAA